MEAASSSMAAGLSAGDARVVPHVYNPADVSMPTSWNTKDKGQHLDILDFSLVVKYTGPGKADGDAASVRANTPISPSCGIYYFEVNVVNKGRDGHIGVGVCNSNVSLNKLPGWEKNSYGYHGDDGNSFRGSGSGKSYGPTFTTGDTVGCIVNFVSSTISFTKNGINLGVAFQDMKGALYPTVGMRTQGEIVEANFGQKPFKFDFEGLIRDERQKVWNSIEDFNLQNRDQALSQLVLTYLMHHGYTGTAKVFARDNGDFAVPYNEQFQSMEDRRKITLHVLNGQIDDAIDMTNMLYPEVLTKDSNILFQLKCQKFVEMVMTRPIEETMAYGQFELSDLEGTSAENQQKVQEVFSLLAYPNPAESPVSYMLDPSRREPVANALNSAILSHQGGSKAPALERLMQQAYAVTEQLRQSQVGAAAFVSIRDFEE